MIGVILPTFNRPSILWHTCVRLRSFLITKEKIHFYIGDAGSVSVYDSWLEEFKEIPENVTIIKPARRNLGNNLNELIRRANEDGCDILLQMDDDHWLKDPLDLDPHIAVLRSDSPVKWIRLMGVAFHQFDARLIGNYWRVKWDSPELYIASNRPHLKHILFHAYYGLYPEDLTLGETEEGFCHNCIDAGKIDSTSPCVGIPVNLRTESMWDHVGASWQDKGF